MRSSQVRCNPRADSREFPRGIRRSVPNFQTTAVIGMIHLEDLPGVGHVWTRIGGSLDPVMAPRQKRHQQPPCTAIGARRNRVVWSMGFTSRSVESSGSTVGEWSCVILDLAHSRLCHPGNIILAALATSALVQLGNWSRPICST